MNFYGRHDADRVTFTTLLLCIPVPSCFNPLVTLTNRYPEDDHGPCLGNTKSKLYVANNQVSLYTMRQENAGSLHI